MPDAIMMPDQTVYGNTNAGETSDTVYAMIRHIIWTETYKEEALYNLTTEFTTKASPDDSESPNYFVQIFTALLIPDKATLSVYYDNFTDWYKKTATKILQGFE